jgi:hypothetical protein
VLPEPEAASARDQLLVVDATPELAHPRAPRDQPSRRPEILSRWDALRPNDGLWPELPGSRLDPADEPGLALDGYERGERLRREQLGR